jgi:hypothetical protein
MLVKIKNNIMKKKFYQKPIYILILVVIIYLISIAAFFTVNAMMESDGYTKNWNIKYSLIQAIIPTAILLIFVTCGKKMKNKN